MHDPLRYRDAYHAALETAAPSEAERTWRRSRFDRGLRLVAELRRRHALAVEGLPILNMGMAQAATARPSLRRGRGSRGSTTATWG